jgi:Fe-S oxidoreductase
MPFECSLCQLCAAVCPVKINPADMFLEMRRQTFAMGKGNYPEHARILAYEKRGTSKRYSYYAFPQGCYTIFFPGCALSGTRSNKVMKLYNHLQQTIFSLGIVLDCCTKPSHDLGRKEYFYSMFGEMKHFLVENGIRKVIVTCPSCYQIFSQYGSELSVVTAYEFMSANGLPETGLISEDVTIHDSCATRFIQSIQSSVRDILKKKGLITSAMDHSEQKTLCCGEGGAVGFLAANLAKRWGLLRKKEAAGRRVITYCVGCSEFIGPLTPTSHILDILFEPEASMAGTVKVSKSPFTYLNRLKLKKQLKKRIPASIIRERTFTVRKEEAKRNAFYSSP